MRFVGKWPLRATQGAFGVEYGISRFATNPLTILVELTRNGRRRQAIQSFAKHLLKLSAIVSPGEGACAVLRDRCFHL